MIYSNNLGLPSGFVRACTSERHNEPGTLSATTLLKGVKEIILTERHWERLSDDVSNRIWAIFGQAVHALMEHEGDNEFTEEYMSAVIDGVKITGRIDNYNMQTGVIADYKTASVWKIKFNDFDDWRKQGLIYAWLLRANGFQANKCQFIALLKDHSKTEAERDREYPQSQIYLYEFIVTDEALKEIEAFITARVIDYLDAVKLPDNEIAPCTEAERWQKKTTYAVKIEGRKTALRVYETKDEAEQHASETKGAFVEYRPGEPIKCKNYCLVNEYCSFWRDYENSRNS